MKIDVPFGAYNETKSFKISRLGEKPYIGKNFNPYLPMIIVDNVERFAQEPIEVRIPVKISKDFVLPWLSL